MITKVVEKRPSPFYISHNWIQLSDGLSRECGVETETVGLLHVLSHVMYDNKWGSLLFLCYSCAKRQKKQVQEHLASSHSTCQMCKRHLSLSSEFQYPTYSCDNFNLLSWKATTRTNFFLDWFSFFL
jgi:hypothetical protein